MAEKNCWACRYSSMEPNDDLCCGHPDAGKFGTYVRRASVEGGHCGPSLPKFEQHPLRNPNGSLRLDGVQLTKPPRTAWERIEDEVVK